VRLYQQEVERVGVEKPSTADSFSRMSNGDTWTPSGALDEVWQTEGGSDNCRLKCARYFRGSTVCDECSKEPAASAAAGKASLTEWSSARSHSITGRQERVTLGPPAGIPHPGEPLPPCCQLRDAAKFFVFFVA
jgi:hypothetical protein